MDNIKKIYKSDQEEFYNSRFDDFGLIVQADGWTSESLAHYYYERVLKLINISKPNSRQVDLLDIGSGHGFFYEYLKTSKLTDNFNYTGIEINENSCKKAQEKDPGLNYICSDFLDYDFMGLNFDFVSFIGTFSIFKSLSELEFYDIALANLEKAFSLADEACILLISRFAIPNESLDKFFSEVLKISPFFDFDSTLFGDYLVLTLYKKKYVLDLYRDFKESESKTA